MNSFNSPNALRESCQSGKLYAMLEDYVRLCTPPPDPDEESHAGVGKVGSKKQNVKKGIFPNLAGFCRYLGIGTAEFEEILRDFPHQCSRILTALEDEALNSELSATLLSAYLKRRLGYDGALQSAPPAEALQISFEHDIFEDGE